MPDHSCRGKARAQPEVRVRGHFEVKLRGQSEAGLSAQAVARVRVSLNSWPESF